MTIETFNLLSLSITLRVDNHNEYLHERGIAVVESSMGGPLSAPPEGQHQV